MWIFVLCQAHSTDINHQRWLHWHPVKINKGWMDFLLSIISAFRFLNQELDTRTEVAFFISGAGLHDLVAVQGDQMCL
jgi:hypothetical protein